MLRVASQVPPSHVAVHGVEHENALTTQGTAFDACVRTAERKRSVQTKSVSKEARVRGAEEAAPARRCAIDVSFERAKRRKRSGRRHAPAGEEGVDDGEEAAKAPSTLVIRTSAARRWRLGVIVRCAFWSEARRLFLDAFCHFLHPYCHVARVLSHRFCRELRFSSRGDGTPGQRSRRAPRDARRPARRRAPRALASARAPDAFARPRADHLAAEHAPRRQHTRRCRLCARRVFVVQQQRRDPGADDSPRVDAEHGARGGGGQARRVAHAPLARAGHRARLRQRVRRRGGAPHARVRQRRRASRRRAFGIGRRRACEIGAGAVAARRRRRGGVGDEREPRGRVRVPPVQGGQPGRCHGVVFPKNTP